MDFEDNDVFGDDLDVLEIIEVGFPRAVYVGQYYVDTMSDFEFFKRFVILYNDGVHIRTRCLCVMAHFCSGTRNPDGTWSYSLQSFIEQFSEAFPDVNIEYDVFKKHRLRLIRRYEDKHCIDKGRSTVLTEETCDMMWKPKIGSKILMFEMIEEKKIISIEDMCGNEVYLGWESVSEVWSLETVLSYRLSYTSASNFKHFYDYVIRAVAEILGDSNSNIYNIFNRLPEKSDNVCCMLEVFFMPEKALFDVQLERRIQEQEQHWTKAIDLKSSEKSLYEKLGALEFDADHEAIYGMERYYTVQQCEQL
ncbi:hypothetical protein FQA39_LY11757 [Lamprigera yunnana]|nr:hypothetical protein FQA39_LY11757 [Lamprigera yunnana]